MAWSIFGNFTLTAAVRQLTSHSVSRQVVVVKHAVRFIVFVREGLGKFKRRTTI